MYFSVCLYIFSISLQLIAVAYAFNLFFKSPSYRLSSGLLGFGLVLMLERRVEPLFEIYRLGQYSIDDAIFSVGVSSLFLLALVQIKKLILTLEEKNFILDHSSKTDSLTQALSRSETFSRAELEIERSLRSQEPVAFLMLDIDHFKNINDQYGHPLGDIVLTNLVKHCQEELRVVDVFGRVGGEEFFVVLPGDSIERASEVAERLRKKVNSMPCAVVDSKEIFISISIGVACFNPNDHGETRADVVLRVFYAKADQAMYQAKTKGRNRTELWSQ